MLEERNDNCRTNLFPLAQLAAAFCGGILLSNTEPPLHFLAVCALFTTVGCTLLLLLRRPTPATFFLFLAFVFAGSTLAALECRPSGQNRLKRLLDERVITPGDPVEVTGVLQQNPESSWHHVVITDHQHIFLTSRFRLCSDKP